MTRRVVDGGRGATVARRRERPGGGDGGEGLGGHGRSGSCSGTFPTRPLGGRSTSRPRNGAHRPTRRGGRIRCRRRRSRLRDEDAFSRSRVACGVEGGRRTREGGARTTARSYRSRHSFPCRAAFGLPRGNYWSNQGQGRELSRAAHFEAIPKMEIPRLWEIIKLRAFRGEDF